jgi:glycosyltransferase involved in cell wall biosynthesis
VTRGFATGYGVVMPAHDEAGTIAATLATIALHLGSGLVIVCNGCSDDTAAIARRAAPDARVIELAAAGKAGAINHGLGIVGDGTVLVVDADTLATPDVLDAVAAALDEPGVMAASPAPHFDLEGADRWVRAYYRGFARHGYLARGVGGSGIWGLSPAGRARLSTVPAVIADDGYVRHFFPLDQQRRVAVDAQGRAVRTIVSPPPTLAALIRTEARWRAGDAQVRRLLGDSGDAEQAAGARGQMSEVRASDRACYVLIKIAGRIMLIRNRFFGTAALWYRDRTPV